MFCRTGTGHHFSRLCFVSYYDWFLFVHISNVLVIIKSDVRFWSSGRCISSTYHGEVFIRPSRFGMGLSAHFCILMLFTLEPCIYHIMLCYFIYTSHYLLKYI